jgi:hypothetical protein
MNPFTRKEEIDLMVGAEKRLAEKIKNLEENTALTRIMKMCAAMRKKVEPTNIK